MTKLLIQSMNPYFVYLNKDFLHTILLRTIIYYIKNKCKVLGED